MSEMLDALRSRERAGNRPLRIAVVGLGYWGPNIVRVLHDLPEAEVAWVCDLREESLARVTGRYPGLRSTISYEDILSDDQVDAVAISTPVTTHYALAVAALDAGKHVFVEKPLAASTAEATDLVTRGVESGLVLMPGHTFLYSPPVNASRDLIRNGDLGDIYFITMSRVNLGLHQPDVSVVWDLAPHDFSILRYWLEESPVKVSATSRACIFEGVPDVAFINLEFESGTIAHIELSWLAPSKLRRTAVVGSEKMLVYDDTSNEPIRIFDSGASVPDPGTFGEYRLTYRSGDILSPRVDVAEPLYLELMDFCESIRNGTQPRSSAAVGLDVVAMTEAVDLSLARDGSPVICGSPGPGSALGAATTSSFRGTP
jgi:predicted dehydrogenase